MKKIFNFFIKLFSRKKEEVIDLNQFKKSKPTGSSSSTTSSTTTSTTTSYPNQNQKTSTSIDDILKDYNYFKNL